MRAVLQKVQNVASKAVDTLEAALGDKVAGIRVQAATVLLSYAVKASEVQELQESSIASRRSSTRRRRGTCSEKWSPHPLEPPGERKDARQVGAVTPQRLTATGAVFSAPERETGMAGKSGWNPSTARPHVANGAKAPTPPTQVPGSIGAGNGSAGPGK